jgi:DNA-binding winged helix-turn-helix (wHTH) protein
VTNAFVRVNNSMPIYSLQRIFYPQNRPCTPKIVGTLYMQGYKVNEKTAIVPPVSKLSGHPETNSGETFTHTNNCTKKLSEYSELFL